MGQGIFKYIKNIIYCIFELIYSGDEHCVICGEFTEESEQLCIQCKKKLRFCEGNFYIGQEEEKFPGWSIFYYSSIIKELIIRLKYRSDFVCGDILAKYMVESIKNNKIQFDLISYVPMTKKALKNRGYNQSEFLATYISKFLNTPVINCLIKIEDTKDQIGLNGEERWKNMQECFNIIHNKPIKDKKILLIDDVITTGATAFYCAYNLKKSGANEVYILTIAKSNV